VGLHLLLALVLVIGPGFLAAKPSSEVFTPMEVVPWKTVDALVTPTGGNPKATPQPAPEPPTPAPQPPQPAPEAAPPEPQRQPERVEAVKPPPRNQESLEPSRE